jgi:hypothetical protein
VPFFSTGLAGNKSKPNDRKSDLENFKSFDVLIVRIEVGISLMERSCAVRNLVSVQVFECEASFEHIWCLFVCMETNRVETFDCLENACVR